MHRAARLLAGTFFAMPGLALAQGTPTLPFKFDRTSEDWSAMKTPANRTQPWHELKWIPLGDEGHITFGGELKGRIEAIDAPNFGAAGLGEDSYLLQRLMLHADVRFNANVRTFVQVSQHEATGRDTFFPLDDGGIDLQQGFAEIGLTARGTRMDVRVGRQELVLSPRLVASREGANIRASYDGARFIAASGPWRGDAWSLQPVTNGEGNFDDEADTAQRFDGARITYSFGEKKAWRTTGSAYFTGRDRQRIGSLVAADERATYGLRLTGAANGIDAEIEHYVQSGSFGNLEVDAFFGGGDVGVTRAELPWSPRFGVRWLYGSGDRSAADCEANTFVGVIARPVCCSDPFWIAPANLFTYAPVLTISPVPELKIEMKYDLTERMEVADAVYAVPLQAYAGTAGRPGPARIASGPSVLASWSPVPEVIFTVSHTRESLEGVLKAVGGKEGRFTWASLTLLF